MATVISAQIIAPGEGSAIFEVPDKQIIEHQLENGPTAGADEEASLQIGPTGKIFAKDTHPDHFDTLWPSITANIPYKIGKPEGFVGCYACEWMTATLLSFREVMVGSEKRILYTYRLEIDQPECRTCPGAEVCPFGTPGLTDKKGVPVPLFNIVPSAEV